MSSKTDWEEEKNWREGGGGGEEKDFILTRPPATQAIDALIVLSLVVLLTYSR